MKKLVILLVLLLLGGGASWWFLMREVPNQEASAEIEEFDEATGLIKSIRYIEIEPLQMPIIREGQVILHLTVVVSVELTAPMTEQDVLRTTVPLRDAVFSELHTIFALRYVQDRGFDLPIVQERLIQAGDRALGDGAVQSVLIRNISKRKPKKS